MFIIIDACTKNVITILSLMYVSSVLLQILKMKRGALIVLEGCDRCGKSTQCKKLLEELTKNNVKTRLMSFPGEYSFLSYIVVMLINYIYIEL